MEQRNVVGADEKERDADDARKARERKGDQQRT
jgi:hypothetical protein